MALKFGTSNVNDVKYKVNSTDKVVTVIQNASGVVYWARPGTLSIDSITGVASTTVSRSATIEPSAGTGALGNGATIYHGDTLKVYPTAATYWKVSSPVTATMNFLATQSFAVASVINPTRKLRKINVSNPDSAGRYGITYVNAAGVTSTTYMSTGSQPSFFVDDTWSGGEVSYFFTTGTVPGAIWYTTGVTSNTIAAANNENDVNIDLSLKTFNLRTYNNGVITYYTSSAMTTAVTQSKYSTSLYYKYTPNNGCYVWNGSSYTTYLSGTVPTNTSYVSGNTWGPFTSEQTNYGRVNIVHNKRGALYTATSSSGTYTKLVSGSLSESTTAVYRPVGTQLYAYASYIGYEGALDGGSAATYGTASDVNVTQSSYRTISVGNGVTTVTFSGSLTSRNITVTRLAGSQFEADMRYISTKGIASTITVTGQASNVTSTYAVWTGCNLTLNNPTLPTNWSITSGYNISSIEHGTADYALSYQAAYDYQIQSSSTRVFSGSASITLNHITSYCYYASCQFASDYVYLSSPATSTTGVSGTLSTSVSGSIRTFVGSIPFSTTINLSARTVRTSIADLTWQQVSSDIWRIYNPNDVVLKLSGTVTAYMAGHEINHTTISRSIAANRSYDIQVTGGESADTWYGDLSVQYLESTFITHSYLNAEV